MSKQTEGSHLEGLEDALVSLKGPSESPKCAEADGSFVGELVALLQRTPSRLAELGGPPELAQLADTDPSRFEQACRLWLQELGTDEAKAILIEEVVQQLIEQLSEKSLSQPLLEEIEALCERVECDGWSDDIPRCFEQILSFVGGIKEQYSQSYFEPDEWTLESAIGDALLLNGFELLEGSLPALRDALKAGDESDIKAHLEWLDEGFLYLHAVKEWSARPWISS